MLLLTMTMLLVPGCKTTSGVQITEHETSNRTDSTNTAVNTRDTLIIRDTVVKETKVNQYQRGDTVYRDSIVYVYVAKDKDRTHASDSVSTTEKKTTNKKNTEETKTITTNEIPKWIWGVVGVLFVAVCVLGLIIRIKRR